MAHKRSPKNPYIREIGVAQYIDSKKKQEKKLPKGNKYQCNGLFIEAVVAHCSNIVVDGQQVIVEAVYKFKEKMTMAKENIKYESKQQNGRDSRKITFWWR